MGCSALAPSIPRGNRAQWLTMSSAQEHTPSGFLPFLSCPISSLLPLFPLHYLPHKLFALACCLRASFQRTPNSNKHQECHKPSHLISPQPWELESSTFQTWKLKNSERLSNQNANLTGIISKGPECSRKASRRWDWRCLLEHRSKLSQTQLHSLCSSYYSHLSKQPSPWSPPSVKTAEWDGDCFVNSLIINHEEPRVLSLQKVHREKWDG